MRELRDPSVGLVTNPIAGVGEQSVGAIFEGHHLASYVARALAFARMYLGRACVVGKSMLFRLSDFRRVCGWSAVRDLLAEDYAIGHAFEQAGLRVAVSPARRLQLQRRLVAVPLREPSHALGSDAAAHLGAGLSARAAVQRQCAVHPGVAGRGRGAG